MLVVTLIGIHPKNANCTACQKYPTTTALPHPTRAKLALAIVLAAGVNNDIGAVFCAASVTAATEMQRISILDARFSATISTFRQLLMAWLQAFEPP